ncbi:LysE family transporter [Actinoplanes sp. NPDC049265]|uniref:LysE family transporter n=1 Tax=Actinoplanes sp. NPDC049265 TaxID=3363902 RepID=UPI0037107265
MVDPSTMLAVAVVALGMAVTPGPNVIYLLSRSIEEGRRSGLVALAGVGIGYVLHLTAAVFGLSAALTAVPRLYLTLQLAGAAYLIWLAWCAVRRNGPSFAAARRPGTAVKSPSSGIRLLLMGTLTNVLNPKAPLMYVSLLPQFIRMERGHLAAQAAVLGGTHIAVSLATHVGLVCGAGSIAAFLERRPSWLRIQRYATAALLFVFAAELAVNAGGLSYQRPAPAQAVEAAGPPTPAKYYIVARPPHGQSEGLFTIAAKTLGDGRRHRELFALNRDRPQPDGGRMTNSSTVEPGWILLLPPDAHGRGVLTEAPPGAERAPSPPAAPAASRGDTVRSPATRGIALALAAILLVVEVVLLSGFSLRRRTRPRDPPAAETG